jgi:hypothetical protein
MEKKREEARLIQLLKNVKRNKMLEEARRDFRRIRHRELVEILSRLYVNIHEIANE